MLHREVGRQKDRVLGEVAVVGRRQQRHRRRRRWRGGKAPQLRGKVQLQQPEVNAGW